ncbi:hypothetical protein ACFS32_22430 [Novosphingobium pokkalii]|uniref:hypothetical protein n=1 Tax=Novosphingobium pokkalii TaxID=1770194 RepID=UPI00364587BA
MVELALGWGAFGKKVIVVSEDAKNDYLKKLIGQWPEIERAVTVLPGRGYKHLLTKSEATELRTSLGDKFKVLVHRDRDSLSDAEVVTLKDDYSSEGIRLWVTDQSDLEAEFCDPSFLSSLTGEPLGTCEAWIAEVLAQNQAPINEQFVSQRAAHNSELHKAGGGPTNDDVWASFQTRPLKGAKGKTVFKQLKNKVPGGKFSDTSVLGHTGFPERATSLKLNLQDLLA